MILRRPKSSGVPSYPGISSRHWVFPSLGRAFLPEEDAVPDAHPVVIVSHRLWKTRLAQTTGRRSNPSPQQPRIYRHRRRCSQMPQTEPLFPADLWVPMMMQAQAMPGQAHKLASRGETWLSVFGRLRPGVTLTQARAELETSARRLEQTLPDENRRLVLPVLTEQDSRTRQLPVSRNSAGACSG